MQNFVKWLFIIWGVFVLLNFISLTDQPPHFNWSNFAITETSNSSRIVTHDFTDFIISQDYIHLACDAMQFGRWIPIFHRNGFPLSWRWRHQFRTKCWYLNVKVCGVTSQKTSVLIFTSMKISILKSFWVMVILHITVIVIVRFVWLSGRRLDSNITNQFRSFLLSSYRRVTALAAVRL